MGRIIPYIMENKKCLKPPTSKGRLLSNQEPTIGYLLDAVPEQPQNHIKK